MDASKDASQNSFLNYSCESYPYSQRSFQNGAPVGPAYITPPKKAQAGNSSMASTNTPSSKKQNTIQLKRVDSLVDSSCSGNNFSIRQACNNTVELVIQIGDLIYRLYGGRLITMDEAETMHNKFLEEHSKGYIFRITS